MADFVSPFWNWWVIALTVFGIVACFLLVTWVGKGHKRQAGEKVETMGHVWDENLEEYNNPLPSWWLNMFYITLVFGIGYLVLYPGLGAFAGILGWTQVTQYDTEIADANNSYGPIYEKFANTNLEALGAEPEAMKIGERLFVTYCTQCHGADGHGFPGFPNLRDNDWLWGGAPETIKQTIGYGRQGAMPAWKDALGEQGLKEVAEYVLSLSDRGEDKALASAGQQKFMMFCVGCHGADGKGNTALGAPNLTDSVWLHGGSRKAIERNIAEGINGIMPAHNEFLGEAKVHLLAAYIYNQAAK